MRKFSGQSTQCQKCGYPCANTVYIEPIHELLTGKVIREEFLRRTCKRCGFRWREKPLDIKEEP